MIFGLNCEIIRNQIILMSECSLRLLVSPKKKLQSNSHRNLRYDALYFTSWKRKSRDRGRDNFLGKLVRIYAEPFYLKLTDPMTKKIT